MPKLGSLCAQSETQPPELCTTQILDRALSSLQHPIAILAGAGISIDLPAGLPSARSLIEQALQHQQAGVVSPADLGHIIDRSTDFRTRPGEFLRFEVAMAGIDRNVRASILSELQSGTPNANHYALAQFINQGHIVITTNFDVHIETAYRHLYGRDCREARHDADFDNPPLSESARVLWKIHGCLTDVDSMAATFTTILSKASSRMKWFENVLSKFDIIVVGYSGSDDLDLIHPLARTITKRSLLWIDHAATGKVKYITPQQWMAHSLARMHLDCVGLTRVMFSCHSATRATRLIDHAIVLRGPTRSILNRVLNWAGISPLIPADPPSVPHGSKSQGIGKLDNFASASNTLYLLHFRRGPKIDAIVDRANQHLVSSGIRGSASRQLDLLVDLYNSDTMRLVLRSLVGNDSSAWNGIANNNVVAFLAKLDALEPMLTDHESPLALRLRGCLLHERDPYGAQRCFEKSLQAAREIGDLIAEINTLSTYSNILYPSHFPVFWHKQRPFPHADRLEELMKSTGFVPMIKQGNLQRDLDYVLKLQSRSPLDMEELTEVGFYDVFWDAWDARRMSIDIGDVRGEMEATFVIAELSLSASDHGWEVPGFDWWIEWQRLYLLADSLGARNEFGKRLSVMTNIPQPEDEISRDELKESMFS